jgi:hypothetical protein
LAIVRATRRRIAWSSSRFLIADDDSQISVPDITALLVSDLLNDWLL